MDCSGELTVFAHVQRVSKFIAFIEMFSAYVKKLTAFKNTVYCVKEETTLLLMVIVSMADQARSANKLGNTDGLLIY
jgi:hypothetical protein